MGKLDEGSFFVKKIEKNDQETPLDYSKLSELSVLVSKEIASDSSVLRDQVASDEFAATGKLPAEKIIQNINNFNPEDVHGKNVLFYAALIKAAENKKIIRENH
jgi:hypothetical protein